MEIESVDKVSDTLTEALFFGCLISIAVGSMKYQYKIIIMENAIIIYKCFFCFVFVYRGKSGAEKYNNHWLSFILKNKKKELK